MSRETDSPSSGPSGRGGAAYPSGTPPYGTSPASDEAQDEGRPAERAEDRKTETTLTTRVKINIPGSRPIPPVVVRTPVGEPGSGSGSESGAKSGSGANSGSGSGSGTGSAQDTAAERRPSGAAGADRSPAEHPAPTEEKGAPAKGGKPASDWFAPRKPSANGTQGGGVGNGGGTSGGSGRPALGPGTSAAGAPGKSGTQGAPALAPGASGAGAGTGGHSGSAGAARPGGAGTGPSAGTGSKSGSGAPGAGRGEVRADLPRPTGAPVSPGHGGGTGSFDVTEALAGGPLGDASRTASGADAPPPRGAAPKGPAGGPAGPTGGPVTGGTALTPRKGPQASPKGPRSPQGSQSAPGAQGGSRNALGSPAGAGLPGGGMSDDTAVLTPQRPAPDPAPAAKPGGRHSAGNSNTSGDTLTSGLPVIPPADPDTGFGKGDRANGAYPFPSPQGGAQAGWQAAPPAPAAASPAPAPSGSASASAKKKGRSKPALVLAGVVVVAAGLYGAGLLMNSSDVPKGTTVLGVNIGGGTRDDAVQKLDDAFAERTAKPLKLGIGDETVPLRPDQAGLRFDTQATVGAAAHSDYNPVSVIGSLFGQERVVDPVMPVDEEKLRAALDEAAGSAGSADGTIKFEAGKATAVYGKTGKGVDLEAATEDVTEAYRVQVERNISSPVPLPTTTRKPTVQDAEVDRMMEEFAKPAMSDLVTVQTDAAHSISFSPEKSLWKFLGVKAVNGKLVESYNQAALKELYGDTFDGVLVTRATGKKTPVTVQDVIGALRPALMSSGNRVGVIDTNPS